jgi:hypothetical protein
MDIIGADNHVGLLVEGLAGRPQIAVHVYSEAVAS